MKARRGALRAAEDHDDDQYFYGHGYGVGIIATSDQVDKLFNKTPSQFIDYHIHAGTVATGIGLAICTELIDRWEAKYTVNSTPTSAPLSEFTLAIRSGRRMRTLHQYHGKRPGKRRPCPRT